MKNLFDANASDYIFNRAMFHLMSCSNMNLNRFQETCLKLEKFWELDENMIKEIDTLIASKYKNYEYDDMIRLFNLAYNKNVTREIISNRILSNI